MKFDWLIDRFIFAAVCMFPTYDSNFDLFLQKHKNDIIYIGTCSIRHLSFPTSCEIRHKCMDWLQSIFVN